MFKMLKIEDGTNLPEIMIYFYINTLGDFIYVQQRAKSRGEMEPDAGNNDEDNAYSDQRALVEILKSRKGFAFANHDEYMRWFRWWSKWHKQELTDEQWRQLSKIMEHAKTEADFAGWRPAGDWQQS